MLKTPSDSREGPLIIVTPGAEVLLADSWVRADEDFCGTWWGLIGSLDVILWTVIFLWGRGARFLRPPGAPRQEVL
ncbi:MAG: hypothetical protein JO110_08205 [Acetobacteraceae bacterium]|nr:hypothetical protein [Acetobacteraceae bacterium]